MHGMVNIHLQPGVGLMLRLDTTESLACDLCAGIYSLFSLDWDCLQKLAGQTSPNCLFVIAAIYNICGRLRVVSATTCISS